MDKNKGSMAVWWPNGLLSTDPGKGIVGFGTAEGAEMCLGTIGMGAGGSQSPDIIVDADFLSVWSWNAAIGDLRPGWFAVGKFCNCDPIVVVLANGMVQLTRGCSRLGDVICCPAETTGGGPWILFHHKKMTEKDLLYEVEYLFEIPGRFVFL